MPRFLLLLPFLLALAAGPAGAQSSSVVESRLRPAVVLAGQPALLEIELDENMIRTMPTLPPVDGLEIAATNANRVVRDKKIRVVINFQITPRRAGTFVIPPVPLPVTGRTLNAPGQTLVACPESEAGPPPPAARKVHAILLAPKRDPYVGERVPIQVLVLVDPEVYLQNIDIPTIARDNFAMDRIENPFQGEMTFAGRNWRSFSYPLRVTALTPGKLQLGPVSTHVTVNVPEEGGGNGIFSRMQQFRLPATSGSVPLEVKPLPPGAPPGFTGAVGQFTIEANFDPAPQHAGDPAAVRLTVRGEGEPAQVTAPHLSDESGWEIFEGGQDSPPPSSEREYCEFDFRRILRPTGPPPAAVPPFEFSFFNTRAGRYETARTEPLPLPQGPATPSATPPVPTLPAALPPLAKLDAESFVASVPAQARWRNGPALTTHALLAANATGAALCLSLVGLAFRRRYAASEEGRRARARRDFRRRLESVTAQRGESDRLVEALRWIEDWKTSLLARPLKDSEAEAITRLARRLDLVRYAPALPSEAPSVPDLRAALTSLLR